MDRHLIASAGSHVYCANGHRLARLTADLHYGDINYATTFDWSQPVTIGATLVRCWECETVVYSPHIGLNVIFNATPRPGP